MPRRARESRGSLARNGQLREARRTVRVHRDAVAGTGREPMLIRAVVHARLLGLRLLTLDARLVIADAESSSFELVESVADIDPVAVPLAAFEAANSQPLLDDAPSAERVAYQFDGGIARARELLAQGADTLATARRPG